jgi:copper chaperone CopZ
MQPVPGTVVLKIGAVGLHCDGCMNRIRTKLFHIQGKQPLNYLSMISLFSFS